MRKILGEHPYATLLIGIAIGFFLWPLIIQPKKEVQTQTVPTQFMSNFDTVPISENGIVYITPNGRRYHLYGCPVVRKSKNVRRVNIEDAKQAGLTPCGRCW